MLGPTSSFVFCRLSLIPSGFPSSAKREVNHSTFSNGRKRLVSSTNEVVCGAGVFVLGVCCSCISLLIFRRSNDSTSAAKPPLKGQPCANPSFWSNLR